MIKQLKGYITQEQIDSIVNIIIKQYVNYKRLVNSNAFQSLFADEYAPHKKQHSVSWAISSGFPSSSDICDGFKIECFKYSKNFTRPLLTNDNISIFILNKTSHFDAAYLNEFYKLNFATNREKVFCYFKFSVNKGNLTKISLCYPNENGTVISKETILERKDIELKLVS